MAIIVAGRYDSMPDAQEAARLLYAAGFSVWDVSAFTVGRDDGDGGQRGAPASPRPSGVLLAIHAGGRAQDAIERLVETGAADLEQAEGAWESGKWADFDPAAAPRLISVERGEPWPRSQVAEHAVQPNETGNEDPGSEIEAYVEHQVSTDAGESPDLDPRLAR